jgi:hypothetical protein
MSNYVVGAALLIVGILFTVGVVGLLVHFFPCISDYHDENDPEGDASTLGREP